MLCYVVYFLDIDVPNVAPGDSPAHLWLNSVPQARTQTVTGVTLHDYVTILLKTV